MTVAPLTGAWIETVDAPLEGGSRGVAPLTGAWIETLLPVPAACPYHVAPLTGAWIETLSRMSTGGTANRRTPHGCVD